MAVGPHHGGGDVTQLSLDHPVGLSVLSESGILSMDGERTVEWLLESDFNEEDGAVSPDGRWMAYTSDETGRSRISSRF